MPIGQGGEQRVVREEGVRADLKRRGGEDKPNDVDARNDGVMAGRERHKPLTLGTEEIVKEVKGGSNPDNLTTEKEGKKTRDRTEHGLQTASIHWVGLVKSNFGSRVGKLAERKAIIEIHGYLVDVNGV
nr:hypothetical protein Iba_chr03aCG3760 [Ipomoea batatas]